MPAWPEVRVHVAPAAEDAEERGQVGEAAAEAEQPAAGSLGEAARQHGRELIAALRHARNVIRASLQNLAAVREEAVFAQRALFPLMRLLDDVDLVLNAGRKGSAAGAHATPPPSRGVAPNPPLPGAADFVAPPTAPRALPRSMFLALEDAICAGGAALPGSWRSCVGPRPPSSAPTVGAGSRCLVLLLGCCRCRNVGWLLV